LLEALCSGGWKLEAVPRAGMDWKLPAVSSGWLLQVLELPSRKKKRTSIGSHKDLWDFKLSFLSSEEEIQSIFLKHSLGFFYFFLSFLLSFSLFSTFSLFSQKCQASEHFSSKTIPQTMIIV